MWDEDARRARIFETANLLAETLRREFPGHSPIIRRPDVRDPERLEIAVPQQARWTVTPSFSAKERLGRVSLFRRPPWLPVECHVTEDLRWRLRTARARERLTRPQRQCLSSVIGRLHEDVVARRREAAEMPALAAKEPEAEPYRDLKRVLLKSVLLQCRCLTEDAVVALVRWTDGWRPPLRSSRDETELFLQELLGVMAPISCLQRSSSSQ